MARSKYIADQAVEAARLCVLKASEAEQRAMRARQKAESLNNCFVVQAGREAAREGYKAAQAGQNATVFGQQTAVWEDPNLPPKDTVRQLEYVARLIESVVDKAAEVAYEAAQVAQNPEGEKPEAEDREAQLQTHIQTQLQECTGKQTDLKRRMQLSTRRLANIMANHDMPNNRKSSSIEKEAQDILSYIEEAEGIEKETERPTKPDEGHWNLLISYVVMLAGQQAMEEAKGTAKPDEDHRKPLIPHAVMLAGQQVTLANYVCALVASRLPQTFSNSIKKKRMSPFCRDGERYIHDIFARADISIKYIKIIYEIIKRESDNLFVYIDNPIIDIDINRIQGGLYKQSFKGEQTVGVDTRKSNSQLIDEKAAEVAQAMDVAVAKVDGLIRKILTIEEADESSHSSKERSEDAELKNKERGAKLENLIDQLSTLASRVAILAHQERIVVWGEDSEEEKQDDPQVLEAVALQVDKIANEASQAAEYASQAAKRAGQSVTQLFHDLNRSSQISELVTQAFAWFLSPTEVKEQMKTSCSQTSPVSLGEVQLVCREADTACKEARNVYEKIEQARRDAEQSCKKGIIAAQSVSWWPVWPWPSPPRWAKRLWSNLSHNQMEETAKQSADPPQWVQWLWPNPSHNQSKETAKQSSEAVDQVGQAAVLAGQAVAQSGQAVTQASQAVAMLGKIVTQRFNHHSLPWPRKSEANSLPLNQIIPVAQQVGKSVVRAGQMAAQASQAANNVALAAQTAQKMAKIAQATQQIEWLTKGRQKWIFRLSMILPLASICMLIILSIYHITSAPGNPALHWIIATIGIAAIIDSYLLMTSLVENIKKMRNMFHRLLTLLCCALLMVSVIFYAFLIWIIPSNVRTIASSEILSVTALISIIILFPTITCIVYYQHCTLNNLHPHEVPTSALES